MSTARILLADDEPLNLEILSESLDDAGYSVTCARDGQEAWDLLQESTGQFDALLLDRMMPRLDGLSVLERVKSSPRHALVPVILQTARTSAHELREGMRAGAFYYLCKPFDDETMLAVVKSAVEDHQRYREVLDSALRGARTSLLLERGTFSFRTPDEARDLAALLSGVVADGARVSMGLVELLLNAVEHGNLGITYEDKSRLNELGNWEAEVARRLELPEHRDKRARVEVSREPFGLRFLISDCGPGFDWRRYLEIDEARAAHTHGRGIAIAKQMCFDELRFLGSGNRVEAILRVTQPDAPKAGS